MFSLVLSHSTSHYRALHHFFSLAQPTLCWVACCEVLMRHMRPTRCLSRASVRPCPHHMPLCLTVHCSSSSSRLSLEMTAAKCASLCLSVSLPCLHLIPVAASLRCIVPELKCTLTTHRHRQTHASILEEDSRVASHRVCLLLNPPSQGVQALAPAAESSQPRVN